MEINRITVWFVLFSRQPQSLLDEGQVAIDGLTISDPTVLEYLEESDDEDPDRLHERVISVGVTAMQAGDTASQTELVRSRFEKMERRLEEDLEAVFGHRGRLR